MSLFQNNFLYDQFINQLPKKWLSHTLGSLVHLKLPQALNQKLIQNFVKYYGIDIEEAEKNISEYDSLGDFFSRRLKAGARPVEGEVIHPCDSLLLESGKVHNQLLIQAKGRHYSVQDFLPENPWADDFLEGSFFTYYLAPHNYHRVHSPVSGEIGWSTYVPGELWPVNSWSVKKVKDLYVVNERVVTGLETEKGKVIVVMVGATNVGSMSFTFDPNIKTNLPGKKERVHRTYDPKRKIQVGDEFGVFHLGSTVVVLYDKKWGWHHQKRENVRMGQSLL